MPFKASLTLAHRASLTRELRDGTAVAQVSSQTGWDVFLLQAPDGPSLQALIERWRSELHGPFQELSRNGTSALVRGRNRPGSAVAAIGDAGGTLLWPAVHCNGHEHYTVLAGDRSSVAAVVTALKGLGDVRLDSLGAVEPDALEVSLPLPELTRSLTTRQLDVLRAAVRGGYYDVPRQATSAVLAEDLGIAASTVREHLRKAEQGVLQRVGELLDRNAPLVLEGTRGLGRPRVR